MEPLLDPCKDRRCKTVPAIPGRPLTDKLLWPKGDGVPDWQLLRSHLHKEGRLTKEQVMTVIKQTSDVLGAEPNLLRLKDPITVVGDVHGQYYDFVKLLEVGGDPSSTQYLFLGDYVDRGSFSIECLLLLFALKINFPKSIWMLRGNHECRQMTAFFNFRDECEYKYDLSVYFAFMDSFDALPIAGIVNQKFLAVHGGLSPELRTVSQLHSLNRFLEPPRCGMMCDLLWSDPVEEKEGEPASRPRENYIVNEVRGCSYFFSYDGVVQFLDKNTLLSVVRAHEAQLEGYKMHRTNAKTGFPTVITIFSAPNYCDVYNNKGAVLKFENNTLNILQFNYTEHPYHLPNFMDVFTWSIPFVAEKVSEMLYYVLHPAAESEEADVDESTLEDLPPAVKKMARSSLSISQNQAVELAARLQQTMGDTSQEKKDEMTKERAERMRNKVRTAARLMRMFKTMRQQNESVLKLGGICPGSGLTPGQLLASGGGGGLGEGPDRFAQSKHIDAMNEKRPELGTDATAAAAAAAAAPAPPAAS